MTQQSKYMTIKDKNLHFNIQIHISHNSVKNKISNFKINMFLASPAKNSRLLAGDKGKQLLYYIYIQ